MLHGLKGFTNLAEQKRNDRKQYFSEVDIGTFEVRYGALSRR